MYVPYFVVFFARYPKGNGKKASSARRTQKRYRRSFSRLFFSIEENYWGGMRIAFVFLSPSKRQINLVYIRKSMDINIDTFVYGFLRWCVLSDEWVVPKRNDTFLCIEMINDLPFFLCTEWTSLFRLFSARWSYLQTRRKILLCKNKSTKENDFIGWKERSRIQMLWSIINA